MAAAFGLVAALSPDQSRPVLLLGWVGMGVLLLAAVVLVASTYRR